MDWRDLTDAEREERRVAAEADQEFIITASRDALRSALDEAAKALSSARRHIVTLASGDVYDVEIAEGAGQVAPSVIDAMLVQIEGIRAVTVGAGR
jgi:hypothetical protein